MTTQTSFKCPVGKCLKRVVCVFYIKKKEALLSSSWSLVVGCVVMCVFFPPCLIINVNYKAVSCFAANVQALQNLCGMGLFAKCLLLHFYSAFAAMKCPPVPFVFILRLQPRLPAVGIFSAGLASCITCHWVKRNGVGVQFVIAPL